MVVGAKERKVFGPDVLQEVEKKVPIVSENLLSHPMKVETLRRS
jgi:hypothetical protein